VHSTPLQNVSKGLADENMKMGNGQVGKTKILKDEQRRKYIEIEKRAKDKLVRSRGKTRGG
jgi:hypothetical protein